MKYWFFLSGGGNIITIIHLFNSMFWLVNDLLNSIIHIYFYQLLWLILYTVELFRIIYPTNLYYFIHFLLFYVSQDRFIFILIILFKLQLFASI